MVKSSNVLDDKMFYGKFINVENLKSIGDRDTYIKGYYYGISSIDYSVCYVVTLTIIGYDFKNTGWYFLFLIGLFFFLKSIENYIKFEKIILTYNLPKRKIEVLLVPSLNLILGIVFSILPFWTTHIFYDSNGVYKGAFTNVFFFVSLYIPLQIILLSFCWKAYLEPFAKIILSKNVLAYR